MRVVAPSLALHLILVVFLPGVVKADELLPVSYEQDSGRVLLEVTLDRPMLYTNTLAAGVGMVRPLLDRGQTGVNAQVRFERHGPKVLLIRDDTQHRNLGGDAAAQRAVAESFPRSVLAAMPIEREAEGVLVVDATEFILSDMFGVARQFKLAGVGEAKLDRSRSYVDGRFSGSFPENSEIRAALTFEVAEPGPTLLRHVPDGRAVSIEQHHSFIVLPGDDYRPREFHPQAGIFPHVFFDFGQGLEADYQRRWISRWRLEPSDEAAYLAGELIEPKQPIVYYLDPAIPEPYRSAFRAGGLWWNEAFEAAGFRDAFQIRDLPDDAHPMDARYNLIHWVHRQARGPSVGPHYNDPRTGEIVRAIVRMDSFRSLVNHDIWMGFRPAAGPDGLALDSEAMAMARRRQHSAHEIGHTLGLAHNFIAAAHDRASVMDYPVPLVSLDGAGHLDNSLAYAEGLGPHDVLAIRYAYTWYPDAEAEREGLARIIDEFHASGVRFVTGSDAAAGGSIPDAVTWVEGNDMFAAADRTLAVRRALIDSFDARALAPGEPLFLLNKRFAHVYFHHRTALVGLAKHIGGMNYRYAMHGESAPPTEIIPAADQRRALSKLLEALAPDALRVPERVSALIAPEPFGWDSGWRWHVDQSLIPSAAGPVFDPLYLSHALAQEIVDHLLEPQRMARVASFHARDPEQPGVLDVLDALLEATWNVDSGTRADPLVRLAQRAALDGLLDLAGHPASTALVRAEAETRLAALGRALEDGGSLARRLNRAGIPAAHREQAQRDITRYFDGRDDRAQRPRPAAIELPWP